jgi:hypothetical protein
MNKNQGLAAGLVLAAALMFRPGAAPPPAPAPQTTTAAVPQEPNPTEARNGPWLASCNYWAPVRSAVPGFDRDPEISGTIDARKVDLHLDLSESAKQERGCNVNDSKLRWGFPGLLGTSGTPDSVPAILSVTALIAIVPDPVHTHLALAFDRTIDALLQAAADNGYVPSYFWLPWKNRSYVLKIAESTFDSEPGHDPDRERQPGLIILRKSYYEVIYAFIVSETASEGVDGAQLQNAFRYEADLKNALPNHFSTGNSPDKKSRVAIVGPIYSGSAGSLRVGISAAAAVSGLQADEFKIAGATYTSTSLPPPVELPPGNEQTTQPKPVISYISFGLDSEFAKRVFEEHLRSSGYDIGRVAFLIEDGTAFARNLIAGERDKSQSRAPLTIRFPRDISSLRNAQSTTDQGDQSGSALPGAVDPYLRFSVKDYSNARDGIPAFSREITPLSQEAQLMTIARQIHRYRIQFVWLSASNVLDNIFLAQFLHRACPEATLVFAGDLLTVREIDSLPFVGSISIGPYPLMGIGRREDSTRPTRTYTSSSAYSYYNAFSYTLWDNKLRESDDAAPAGDRYPPALVGYNNQLIDLSRWPYAGSGAVGQGSRGKDPRHVPALQPPLWATTIGNDGYYPLGILSPCSTDDPYKKSTTGSTGATGASGARGSSGATAPTGFFLPWFDNSDANLGTIDKNRDPREVIKPLPQNCTANNAEISRVTIYPSRLWDLSCALVIILCLFHAIMLQVASYWSPFSHDLAVGDNDLAPRRAFYINVASGMLFAVAFVISFPVLWLQLKGGGNLLSTILSIVTLMTGLVAVLSSRSKTHPSLQWQGPPLLSPSFLSRGHRIEFGRLYDGDRGDFYVLLNLLLRLATVAIICLWGYSCITGSFANQSPDFAGLSFSFRSINPGTGVSPLEPVVLLLLGWHFWAMMQTRRLRFSEKARPKLPQELNDPVKDRLFLSDNELARCQNPADSCLYNNITCLMITRQFFGRFFFGRNSWKPVKVDVAFALVVGIVFFLLTLSAPVRSADHFVWNTGGTLLSSPYEFLFLGLMSTLIAVCLTGWFRMTAIWQALRRSVLDELENLPIRFGFSRLKGMGWMTMLRQGGLQQQWKDITRSVESISHMGHQPGLSSAGQEQLQARCDALMTDIVNLNASIANPGAGSAQPGYQRIEEIEKKIAEFSQFLLSSLLIPYWQNERTGLVEGRDSEQAPVPEPQPPAHILAAEEFLVIRYISLITAVLANLRYLMTFVMASFVLAFLAWNSSSFQPRQLLDWAFTILLLILGSGVIVVFAQMHRNPILSRITDTRANELGWDFYFRILSFGAIPVLTWVAYQFPDFGSMIYRIIEPAVPIVK